MPDHVRLILNPGTTEALSRPVGQAHRRAAGFVNARARETGRLFQGRVKQLLDIARRHSRPPCP